MSDYEITRELNSLKGEKAVGELMLKGHRNSIAEQLRGDMGSDMMEVLSGRKKVKLSWKYKLIHKINRLKTLLFGRVPEPNDEMGYYTLK